MISFEEEKKKFNYRVAGVALDVDRVLLHRIGDDDFWSLPGGRVDLLEPSQDALIREMREELGVEVRVERLLWVVENFFEHKSKSYHELGLYFLMSFPPDSYVYEKEKPFAGDEEGIQVIFKWHSLDELEKLPLRPAFLRKRLTFPQVMEHIVIT